MTTQPADEDTLIQAARAERGQPRLRSDTVPGATSGNVRDAPRGIVTLCGTPGCDYAAARVTRASGAA